jgi:probable rRNA maturation factor
MSRIALDIMIDDPRWRRIPHLRTRLEKAARMASMSLPNPRRYSCAVTVLLTNDATMRSLNRDFRGKNRPTNVLSFPQFEPRELTKKGKNGKKIHMGDLALGYQYIARETKKGHKILINHVVHLLIHGILHLFGYDHGLGTEAFRMEQLETRIMAGLGLPDPYAPQPREPKAR